MLEFAEEPRPVIVLGEDGKPLFAGDPHRFFEASWMHKYKGKILFLLFYGRYPSVVLCGRRQSLWTVYYIRRNS